MSPSLKPHTDAARAEIVDEARAWLRTPYHHMGRVKGAGVDCGTLLLEVFKACGHIPHIDTGYYPPDWHLHRSEERYLGWIERYAHRVDVGKPGDLALFKFGRCISHGAIIVEWPIIIHAYIGQGCRLDDATQGQLGQRFAAYYSIFGGEDGR